MKIARIAVDGVARLAEVRGDKFALRDETALEQLFSQSLSPSPRPAEPLPRDRSLSLHAPLRPPKIVAVGLNYLDHISEAGLERPSVPLLFAKFATAVIGPEEAIIIDASLTERVDWEVELAVIVGQRLRNATEPEVAAAIFGYTVANDISARDIQFSDGQWVRGKSLNTFCPLGPVVTTPDELGDPQSLRLCTRVNGETVQEASTSQMVFGVLELLSFCSRSFTLEPGDVVLTGTPWGCGEFMEPKRSLQPGDTVEVEIDGIGVLRNPVAAA